MNQIGPFQVLEELARGGMGVVYRAQAPDGTHVALKLLLAQRASNPQARERFVGEARTLSRLRHPNLVSILAVGQHQGAPWIALDFVDGPSLEERLRAGPLSIEESVRIGRDLARALAYVHTCGVLHRDLKPGNVLLSARGALLTDFGLAHDVGSKLQLTATGVFLGTPGYWPPEQAMGQRSKVGPGSDLYGLGAVLYACLTGKPPVSASSIQEYLTLQVNYAEIPTAQSVRAEVPNWLSALVRECLSEDASDRPRSAVALEQALIHGSDPHAEQSAPRRGWALAAAALAVLGAATGAVVLWSGSAAGPLPDRPQGEQPEVDPSHAESTAADLVDECMRFMKLAQFDAALSVADRAVDLYPRDALAWAARGTAKEALRQYPAALSDLDHALELDPRFARGWARRASIRGALKDLEGAFGDYSVSLRHDPDYAPAWFNRGNLKDALGRDTKDVIADYDRALKIDPNHTGARFNRGNQRAKLGDLLGALADYDHSLALRPDDSSVYLNRGVVKRRMRRFREALDDLERAGELNPDDPLVHLNRGACLVDARRPKDALPDLALAIQLLPRSASAFLWQAKALALLERHAEALPAYQRSVELNPSNARTHLLRALSFFDLGRHREALACLDRALELNPQLYQAHYTRGNTLALLGEPLKAIEDFSATVRINPRHVSAYVNRGVQLRRQGRLEEALRDYTQALRIDPENPSALYNRGNAYCDLERLEEALTIFEVLAQRDIAPDLQRLVQQGLRRVRALLDNE